MADSSGSSLEIYAIRSGVIVGISSATMLLLVYMINFAWLVDWRFNICAFVSIATLVVWLGNIHRKEVGGYLSFGRSFKLTLIIYSISSLIHVLFTIVLYNVIDPELPVLMTEVTVENTEKFMRFLGAQRSQIEAQIELLEKEVPLQFSPIGQLKSSWLVLLFSTIFALIAAAFIKRNKPLFDNV